MMYVPSITSPLAITMVNRPPQSPAPYIGSPAPMETLVGEVALPRNVTAAPMTYMRNGTQFIVVATGGANLPAELAASRLT